LRFKSLGSGSTGNATVVETSGSKPVRLLIDCGFGLKQLAQRLSKASLAPSDIDAVFITHEHGDHIGSAVAMALQNRIPVWMSLGTYEAISSPDLQGLLRIAKDSETIDLGSLRITPFTVPHDAREPLQLSCTQGSSKLGVVTDLGHATPHVLNHLQQCNAMVLECNHDTDLLASSNYPAFLKKRVGGSHGHLSNTAAAAIADRVNHPDLHVVVAAHLSQQNNRPDLVRAGLGQALGCSAEDIVIATPDQGCDWLAVQPHKD
jgi:phosphoribosyl 1,2-cyclic phosphodiesterase